MSSLATYNFQLWKLMRARDKRFINNKIIIIKKIVNSLKKCPKTQFPFSWDFFLLVYFFNLGEIPSRGLEKPNFGEHATN